MIYSVSDTISATALFQSLLWKLAVTRYSLTAPHLTYPVMLSYSAIITLLLGGSPAGACSAVLEQEQMWELIALQLLCPLGNEASMQVPIFQVSPGCFCAFCNTQTSQQEPPLSTAADSPIINKCLLELISSSSLFHCSQLLCPSFTLWSLSKIFSLQVSCSGCSNAPSGLLQEESTHFPTY